MTQHDRDAGYEDEDDVPEWADQVMLTLAAEVRRRRKEKRLSAQELADKCEEIGHPIPRNVIANMESGRRANLPLVDVMVLAKALNTPPICLIYPVGYVEDVQRLPFEDTTSALNALNWFTGEDDDLGAEDDMLRYYRAHEHAETAIREARQDEDYARWQAKMANNAERKAEALATQARATRRIKAAKRDLRSARAFIQSEGGTLPFLWPDLASEIAPDQAVNYPAEETDF
ncbi:helix-turn-helix domain-containing protein [Streptomyces boninensis]|uniref:helix-turn-helix domain-containing protein n=1 Tax=Streptomyces boninensis TaxID=2039455 RepID=UPI003B21311B